MRARSLKRGFQENKFDSVYLPYWTFNAQVEAGYSAQGGKVYYVTEGFGENRRRVRRVNWYPVRGRISRFFNNVLINAKGVRDKLLAHAESFSMAKLLPFDAAYLSGYKAEKYTTTPEQGFQEAKGKMIEELKSQARCEILRYYDEVRSLNVTANFSGITYKHILAPFWMSSYMYRDKLYRFVINAQTGKVNGETPISKIKVAVAVVVALILLSLVLVYFINHS